MAEKIIVEEYSAILLLEVLWNIALADGLLDPQEVSELERVSEELGVTSKVMEDAMPLEKALSSVKDPSIGPIIYNLALKMAAVDGIMDQYQANMLDIIREHFSISQEEAKKLARQEYSLSVGEKEATKEEKGEPVEEDGEWKKVTSALSEAGRWGLKGLRRFADEKISTARGLANKENIEKFQGIFKKAAADTWVYMKETPEVAIEKYKKMDKSNKVMAISAMAGGAIVSIPFIVAVGPLSIVSALAALGLGSLAVGGYGVAGGIIVTAGGAALSAALAGLAANKVIKDPEVQQLIDNYTKLETIIKQNFSTMEKHQDQYKKLYAKYGEVAKFVAHLQEQIGKEEKYDIDEIKDKNNRIRFLIEDLETELAHN